MSFSWHFFRELDLCLRFYGDDNLIDALKVEANDKLFGLEKSNPDLFKEHYYGAFLVKDKEYNGEEELYGKDAWELCYKRWETGSNLALLLCTTDATKSIPFHYTRDIHLLENQLGLELPDAITIYLKWIKRLMESDESYKKHIPSMDNIIKQTWRESRIKGL
jgi:hypothetical protein